MADESLINGGRGGRAQRRQVNHNGWNKKRRSIFLKTLTETCNVALSTRRAGMGPTSAYPLRHRDPAFARLWDEALSIGYDRLETLLLQRALEGVNDIDVAALSEDDEPDTERRGDDAGDAKAGRDLPGTGLSPGVARAGVQLALAMLNRRGPKDGMRARGRKAMGSDEVDALLTKKLDALARRRDGK